MNMEFSTLSEEYEADYDFNQTEDVLFLVEEGRVAYCAVIRGEKEAPGSASFEIGESGCFDYMIESALGTLEDGWWIMERAQCFYTRGDGWEIDDDCELDFESFRRATKDEYEDYE